MPSNSQIRLVLFDVGGVLVELSGLPMLLDWLRGRMTLEEIYTFWLTSPVVRAFETGKMAPEDFAARLVGEIDLPVTAQEFMKIFDTWIVRLLPGAVELVQGVPRHYVRATLCNSNTVHWPRLAQHPELMGAFDRHFASHLTGKIKPDEDAFHHALNSLGFKPEETIFVDDSRLNIAAAKKLGILAYQVKGPAEAERALREAGVIAG